MCATALAGGGMAAAGLALRKAIREAVWQGYELTIIRLGPPPQPAGPVPAATKPVPVVTVRSPYANDGWKGRQRSASGQFLPKGATPS